jgi:hypothetical protein
MPYPTRCRDVTSLILISYKKSFSRQKYSDINSQAHGCAEKWERYPSIYAIPLNERINHLSSCSHEVCPRARLSPSWWVLKQFHNGVVPSSAKYGDFDNNGWKGLEEQT